MDKSIATNGSALAQRPETGLAQSEMSSLEAEMADIMNASKIAAELAKSSIVPEALQGKPANVLIIIMMGRDFGWSAMQSVRFIDVVKGRPAVSAAAKVGLCQSHPTCEYFRVVSSDEKTCTWETKRKGVPDVQRYTFTMADAERRGLAGSHQYKTMPKNMLSARASAGLANQAYADVVAGLYSREEMEDADVRDIGGGQSQKAAWETFVGMGAAVSAPPPPKKEADVVVEPSPSSAAAEVSAQSELESGTFAEGTPEKSAQALIARLRGATTADDMRQVGKESKALPTDLQDAVAVIYAAEKPRVLELEQARKKAAS